MFERRMKNLFMTAVLISAAFGGLLFAGTPIPSAGDDGPGWLRYPAISPDGTTIVFTYKGNLYRVAASGGDAALLTTHEAEDYRPVWSPDGRSLAFASDRYGNFDIFLMPAEGGEAVRLTFHSADEIPFSFTPDGTGIVFGAVRQDSAANRQFPDSAQPELYVVPVSGGRVRQILTTPAEDAVFSRDGRFLLYHDKKGGENEWRKHHTSSVTRDIWIYDLQAGTHRKITSFAGEDRSPKLVSGDQAFYYLSEESGSFNVRRMSLDGGASEQITAFKTHPVRFLSLAGNGMLCFGYDGAIYTQTGTGPAQKVNIRLATDDGMNRVQNVDVSSGVTEMAVAPSGKEIAFIARGEVFVASVEGGVTKRVTDTPGREESLSFSPDGKGLAYGSERDGRWLICESRRTRNEEPYFYASTVLAEKILIDDPKGATQPLYSPDGKEIAYIEGRMNLKVLNLASGQSRTLLTKKELFANGENDQYFRWSPDGRWLLFDYAVPGIAPGEVGLVSADGKGAAINLTQSGFNDARARWILDGKAMLWFSNRDGLNSVAQSGATQQDAYAMFFTREAWDRFRLSKEDYALLKEEEDKAKEDKEKAEKDKTKEAKDKEPKVEPLTIDLEDIALRKARLTIHSSALGDALLSKDGETLYYLARFEKGLNLWTTSVRTRETKMLLALDARSGRMDWDKEQKNIFLLADGSLSKIDPAGAKKEPVAVNGEMRLRPAEERRAMFDHVWRKTRDTFYTAGFHGADWEALRPVYEKHVPDVGPTFEFAELLSELLGELNISHSGARCLRRGSSGDATASLGAFYDLAYDGPGYRVEEIIKNGPLDKAEIKVRPGMILASVDGEEIPANRDLAAYLNRKADKRVLLGIRDGDKTFEVVVKPISLGDESDLLYTRYVLRNREEVERLSGGRLGYVHIAGMSDESYRTTFEDVLGRFAHKDGLVVDTRFNGGGDLVADLAMFLSGRKFFDYTTDDRSVGFEPNFRWTKPSISLAGEDNYSDAHCYADTYKELKIGKLVGMPVPGTCTFSGWEMLPEPGLLWGVPPVGVKNPAGVYLENHQTEPDILVRNDYDAVAKGRDLQLEAAVAALMKEMK
ncbi:MAG: S41 family peptidase [Candidatus Aminicenantales bacterium]